MSAFYVCLNAVAPIFLMMALGFIARRLGAISRDEVPKLNKLVFRYFMPIMLFYNLYTSDISSAIQPKLLIFTALCVLLAYDGNKRGVKIQGLYRSNFVIIGLPLASQLVEGADLGCVVVLIAVVVPMFNVLAVVTLEIFNGKRPAPGRILLDILKNPLVIGTAAGLVTLIFGIRLPGAIVSAVKQVGAVPTPCCCSCWARFSSSAGSSATKRISLKSASAGLS